MTERIYRDVHPDLYRELVEHAEHRGLTVNAWLEDLAIAYHSTHNPDGTRRPSPIRIPRGWQAEPDPVPVVGKSGRARAARGSQPAGRRAHYLDDPAHAAEFRRMCEEGISNARMAVHFNRGTQTMTNWREKLGIPPAGERTHSEVA